jgi:hypothetical protein
MRTHARGGAPGDTGERTPADRASDVLDQWLHELERLDEVLAAQSDYLDAVESGATAAPPAPFVGTPGLPQMPSDLTPYARDLLARNEAVNRRALTLSAQLRPRQQRPMHIPTPLRGNRFEGRG